MYHYAQPVSRLIAELMKLPSVGPKTAQRLAFYIIKSSKKDCRELAEAILEVKEKIKNCKICYNLTDKEVCEICDNEKRDHSILCVVSDARDIASLEACREFKGVYHVLGGVISMLDGIGPEQLNIEGLLARTQKENIKEVILAVGTSLNGEATALYLGKILKPMNVKVTRLALGLPAGAELEYADEVTLAMALSGRGEIQ